MFSALFVHVLCIQIFLASSNIETSDRDTMGCHCLYEDNKWFYLMTDLLHYLNNNFSTALSQPLFLGTPPAAQFVLNVECHPEGRLFPNSRVVFDVEALDRVGGAGLLQGSAKLEFMGFCIPGNVILSLLCAQKMIYLRNLQSAIRWVEKTQHLFSFVQNCMDAEAPFPILASDIDRYIQQWRSAKIPLATSAHFVPSVIFRGVA